MPLTLLHTAEVHRATFDAIAARIAPGVLLHHVVRPDWLARAQGGIEAPLEAEIAEALSAAHGPVLCSCTTLGPVAGALGAIRIDAPMMDEAARIAEETGGDIVMAYCLQSTLTPSAALLDAALEARGHRAKVHALSLAQFWPLFEAGQIAPFHAVIASGIRENMASAPRAACVVLAQASMAGAAPLLPGLGLPVLTSPETALRAALDMAS
ncbi:hypothetical protein ACEWPL_007595 [Roseovarius sp. S1116L3]|uniref:hypothetical protein n=1 Tax=Roseovarius roseus TaxID=3342636 RepID=UPI003729987C